MRHSCGLSRSSTLVDVGAGLGRCARVCARVRCVVWCLCCVCRFGVCAAAAVGWPQHVHHPCPPAPAPICAHPHTLAHTHTDTHTHTRHITPQAAATRAAAARYRCRLRRGAGLRQGLKGGRLLQGEAGAAQATREHASVVAWCVLSAAQRGSASRTEAPQAAAGRVVHVHATEECMCVWRTSLTPTSTHTHTGRA
jgi:hypothetical protein